MGMASRRRSNNYRKMNRLLKVGTTEVGDLTDDLLELVLLGIDTSVCLVRAAATCKRWRRLVAGADGAAFLRRFQSLHPPRPIGTFYSINPDRPRSYGQDHIWPDVDPVFVPSSASASAFDEPSGGPQLSLDFVPGLPAANRGRRELVDGRGSLLLLLGEKDRNELPWDMYWWHHADYMTRDLIVCQPLTRQYQVILPPIGNVCILGAFLLNSDANEAGATAAAIGMTNFRVLLVHYEHDYSWDDEVNGHGHPLTSVFTCGGCGYGYGGWQYGEKDEAGVCLPLFDQVHLAGRTGGRIYWGCDDKQVVVLDECTLQFSAMALSEHMMQWLVFGRDNFRVVGGDHAGTIVRIVHLTHSGGLLEVFGHRHGDRGNDEWVLEKTVLMAEASRGLLAVEHQEEGYFDRETRIIDADEGLVVLSLDNEMFLFSVDLETMELKREDGRNQSTGAAFPYTLPWSPVMRACVDDAGSKRRKRSRKRRRKRPSSEKS
ncbi:unnamed protein product [Urochloa decumbens]|uniref:F-box protein AT5G49610-like beta-propeller domain-containing protein n=1 Tax=Urochloa decumbens TaxID=240449 RepID=A0ABC9G9T6_9POAL